MPKVSVIVPVYNGEAYLREALDSLLAQTWSDFDVWIVDDGSTDGTPDILAAYTDWRVHVHRQPNRGQTGALNTGLCLAEGGYIARLDADDIALPDRLAHQTEFLDLHQDVALIGSDYLDIDERGQPLRVVHLPTTDRDLRQHLGKRNPFAHSTIMMRRELLQRIGLYIRHPRYPQFQDYELWIRIAAHAPIASLPLPLVHRRVHRGSISAAADDARLRCEIDMRAHAIRTLRLPVRFWVYVWMPALALRLPLTWRDALRRSLGRVTSERR